MQFPYDVNSSEECRHLIHKILTPVKYRIYISKIKTHPWLARISAAHENDKTDIKPVRLKVSIEKNGQISSITMKMVSEYEYLSF